MEGKREFTQRHGPFNSNVAMRGRHLNEAVQSQETQADQGEASERTPKEAEEAGSLANAASSGSRLSTSNMTYTQRNTTSREPGNHTQIRPESLDHRINGQTSLEHQLQGPSQRDRNQNLSGGPRAEELIGIGPARERNTRPPETDAEARRRMAVCDETDDAQHKRTKMRVYMKRF